MLRLLLRATEAEKVRWIQDNDEEYHSDDLSNCCIRFFYVSLSDGEAEFNDRDRVEVSVGRSGGVYYIGTEGYSLATAILSAGLPKWKEGRTVISEAQYEAREMLERLLGHDG